MLIIYGICTFILSSSAIMVGYVWIRDIKNTKEQAAKAQNDESREETELSEEILADYPNLVKKTA